MVVAWNIHQHNRHYSSRACCDLVFPSHRLKIRMRQHITSLLKCSSHQRRNSVSLGPRSLCSEPPLSYYRNTCSSSSSSSSSCSIPFTSIDLSFLIPNYLQYKQRNESSSSNGDETYDNLQQEVFVYYTVSIDGRQSRITKINVSKGDDIDSIIDEIKTKGRPDFDDVPGYRIELFESVKHKEPLHALETWNPSVTWGTKQHPLIVKVNPSMVTVNNSFAAVGKCGMLLILFPF